MLSTPQNGWSTFTLNQSVISAERVVIDGISLPCSYLEDVPVLLLNTMKRSCEEHQPASCWLDAEGWGFVVVFDWLETYIIVIKGSNTLYSIGQNRDDIARELISDIRKDMDVWVDWQADFDVHNETEVLARKVMLEQLCIDIEVAMPSDDWVRIQ